MTTDTNPQLAEFISSQLMEHSEMKERVISLGKALVHELDLEPGCDTLARWMAHYVAEKIVAVEKTKGDEKNKAEKICFETILKLWENRSSLPDGRRPFESFEPIFRALESMDPENPYPRLFSRSLFESEQLSSNPEPITDNVQEWLDIVYEIDRAARILIQFSFKQAAILAADEKTEIWMKHAISCMDSKDISIMIRLFSDKTNDEDSDNQARKEHAKSLKSKIEQLDDLQEICRLARSALNDELEGIA